MFVVISFISVSLLTDALSVCFSFVNHSLVDMLWEHNSMSFIAIDFLSSVKPFFLLLSSTTPILTPSQGQSVCREDALDGFLFLFCCKLRYSVISDLAFSGFRRRSHCSPRSLTAMLGYDKSHRTQRRLAFFCLPLRHPNSRHPFHLQQPRFVILYPDSSFSLSPHPPSIFNNIYI